jgi:hypothetical protein
MAAGLSVPKRFAVQHSVMQLSSAALHTLYNNMSIKSAITPTDGL